MRPLFVLFLVLAAAVSSSAQTTPATPADHQHHAAVDPVRMFPLRDASGTGWQPEATPMQGMHRTWGAWETMFHGNAFVQFLYEPAERHRTGGFASRQVSSANWGMLMARRPAGTGRVGMRAMVSVEPWTVSDCGYLNFLATGETCEGDTIHDRQHPHDLFMEIAADYDRPVGRSVRWQVYAGLAGEPALGPGGFPHRMSALVNPVAPISHHWLDSTHVTFGVVTTGLYDRRWKGEISAFNGREPDEQRADLDLGPLDSVAGRLSLLPTDRLALQVSGAFLREAEPPLGDEPAADVGRITASAAYHRPLGASGMLATTLAYGANAETEAIPGGSFDAVTHAVMLESSLILDGRGTWFGRAEAVGKPAHDLHVHEYPDRIFTVGKVQLGYVHELRSWRGMSPGVGGTIAVSLVPAELESRYSGRAAFSFGLFLSVRPSSSH